MEENNREETKLQSIFKSIKTAIFELMEELVKDKKINRVYGGLLIFVMYFQIIGVFFDSHINYDWKDDYLLSVVRDLTNYVRIVPMIYEAKATNYLLTLFVLSLLSITGVLVLMGYVIYSQLCKNSTIELPIKILRFIIPLLFYFFFMPIMEGFFAWFHCDNGKNNIFTNMECFVGVHIFIIILCLFYIIFLLLICGLSALLYNHTLPNHQDALSRMEINNELLYLAYRVLLAIAVTFFSDIAGQWIIICGSLAFSVQQTYQYFIYIPYYDRAISLIWGCLICNYLWISLNSFFMMLINVYGHIIIISIGIPIICGLIFNLRELRVESLVITPLEKLKADYNALNILITIQNKISQTEGDDVTLIGLVNLHVFDCQTPECPCKPDVSLYDVSSNSFSERKLYIHRDSIFLKHFCKRLYEECLNKFSSSPLLRIAFAYYMFEVMKNVHTCLTELEASEKKKPTLQQSFTIFRIKKMISKKLEEDVVNGKDAYSQLTNVIEFENLVADCQKAVEKVAGHQIDFWSQVSNQTPDLNVLHELSKKIHEASQEAEEYWSKLIKINNNYPKALNMYGTYMVEIKNNSQVGVDMQERGKINTNKKSLDQIIKSADVLFVEDTCVIHISGNKGTTGRITKTNQGLVKLFGYSKNEVIGHSINILMPSIISKRHTEILEKFFKTAHKTVFSNDRNAFGLHRNGFCFGIKLHVKQMPTLEEGVQYVGMIRSDQSDSEYILLDQRGVIDCFSSGITSLLNLPVGITKEIEINIQILAPELIRVYNPNEKRKALIEKYKEVGGYKLFFVVPKDFGLHCHEEQKKQSGGQQKKIVNNKKMKQPLYKDLNKDLNKHGGVATKPVTISQLLQTTEYKDCEVKQSVKCEIQDLQFANYFNDFDPLNLRVLKIMGLNLKAGGSQSSVDNGEQTFLRELPSLYAEEVEGKMLPQSPLIREQARLLNLIASERKDEEPSEKREDSKMTEQIYQKTQEENLVTNESPSFLRIRFRPDPVTGALIKKGKAVHDKNMSENKEDEEKSGGISVSSSYTPREASNNNSSGPPQLDPDNAEGEETPKMQIGQIVSPEFLLGKEEFKSLSLADPTAKLEDIRGKQEEPQLKEVPLIPLYKIKSDSSYHKKIYSVGDENDVLSPNEEKKEQSHAEESGSSSQKNEIQPPLKSNDSSKMPSKELQKVSSQIEAKIPLRSLDKINFQSAKSPVEDEKKGLSESEKIISANNRNRFSIIGSIDLSKQAGGKPNPRSRRQVPSKIMTNPALTGEDPSNVAIPEYHQTEEEKNVRRAFMLYEKKKNNEKDAGKEVKEEKKETTEENKEESEESEGEEKEKSEEETKKEIIEDDGQDQDTQSSITSGSTASTMRSFYSLRAAIDEKFVPPSIRNMEYASKGVFVLLLSLAIVYYVMQITLYEKINSNIKTINYAAQRRNNLIEINLQIVKMLILGTDYTQRAANSTALSYMSLTQAGNLAAYQEAIKKLIYEADLLKEAEIGLSFDSLDMSDESQLKINPENIVMEFKAVKGMPSESTFKLYQALLEIVVSSYRLAVQNITEISYSGFVVRFITRNSLNNLIGLLKTTSDAIMDETVKIKNSNMNIFLILLCVASFALGISTTLLLPVINKIKSNKQDVLILFMHIKKLEATNQMNKCRKFLGSFQSNQETELIVQEGEELEKETPADVEDAQRQSLRGINNLQVGTSLRKFKPLVLNLGFEIFKFIFLILIMEGYFLMKYFLSSTFLTRSISLAEELDQLIARFPTHSLVLLAIKFELFTNYSENINGIEPKSALSTMFSSIYEEEEKLLDKFTENSGYHSDSYSRNFNQIIFSNICGEFSSAVTACQEFNQGILQKGVYSTVIKFWDYLRQINSDFLDSSRLSTDQYNMLGNEAINVTETMQNYYLNISLESLVVHLSNDIDIFNDAELNQDLILFIVYICYLVLVYFAFWMRFIHLMQKELWSTKAVLCILAPEQIMNISEIKSFILNNSSMVFFSKGQLRLEYDLTM